MLNNSSESSIAKIDRSDNSKVTSAKTAIKIMQEKLGLLKIDKSVVPSNPFTRQEIEDKLGSSIKQVTLCLTEDCNLRCRYCIYSGSYSDVRTHSSKKMKTTTAIKSIEYFLNHTDPAHFPPFVGFYGGEPLLQFELIKKCINFVESNYPKSNVHYNITTNGTLLNKNIADFLIEKKFNIAISLDGGQTDHDKNRVFPNGAGSHDCVIKNLEYIKEKNPQFFYLNIQASVVISPPVNYSNLNDFFSQLDMITIPSDVELYKYRNDVNGNWDLKGWQVLQERFAKDCIENRYNEKKGRGALGFAQDIFGTGLRSIKKRDSSIGHDRSKASLGQCVPGVRKIFVSSDGEFYPCEKVEGTKDVSIGNVTEGINPDRVWNLLERFYSITKNHCSNCWLVRICPICLTGITMGGTFDENKLDHLCRSVRQQYSSLLSLYCKIIEKNKDALDYLTDDLTL